MNEFLGGADGGRRFGSPHFSDRFDATRHSKYHDSPLSDYGRQQVRDRLALPTFNPTTIDLVVVSPLTRALQTYDLGLKHHFPVTTPVLALPEAAERLYLISDQGQSPSVLSDQFPYVDFSRVEDHWWYTPPPDQAVVEEWRPTDQHQQYACPGEPPADFADRMRRLVGFLRDRPEPSICVVSHHGVLEWLLDEDFDNCQVRTVALEQLRSH